MTKVLNSEKNEVAAVTAIEFLNTRFDQMSDVKLKVGQKVFTKILMIMMIFLKNYTKNIKDPLKWHQNYVFC